MSLFDWLLVSHLVGDFLVQTDKMARNKTQSWPWMLRHVACYMAVVVAGVLVYAWRSPLPVGPTLLVLLFIAATHVVLDRRGFTSWWMRVAGVSPQNGWLAIVIDQVFHVVSLAMATEILLLMARPGNL